MAGGEAVTELESDTLDDHGEEEEEVVVVEGGGGLGLCWMMTNIPSSRR